jgi:hypothetical protein
MPRQRGEGTPVRVPRFRTGDRDTLEFTQPILRDTVKNRASYDLKRKQDEREK